MNDKATYPIHKSGQLLVMTQLAKTRHKEIVANSHIQLGPKQ
jgi:hypothetical protein